MKRISILATLVAVLATSGCSSTSSNIVIVADRQGQVSMRGEVTCGSVKLSVESPLSRGTQNRR